MAELRPETESKSICSSTVSPRFLRVLGGNFHAQVREPQCPNWDDTRETHILFTFWSLASIDGHHLFWPTAPSSAWNSTFTSQLAATIIMKMIVKNRTCLQHRPSLNILLNTWTLYWFTNFVSCYVCQSHFHAHVCLCILALFFLENSSDFFFLTFTSSFSKSKSYSPPQDFIDSLSNEVEKL